MSAYQWSVMGTECRYGQPRAYASKGVIEADSGEHALHQLLVETPGPWDELNADAEFSITIKPG